MYAIRSYYDRIDDGRRDRRVAEHVLFNPWRADDRAIEVEQAVAAGYKDKARLTSDRHLALLQELRTAPKDWE